MKKHLSVVMLMARSSIYGLLGIIIGMAAAEGALFYFALKKALSFAQPGFELSGLHTVFEQSGAPWPFAVCFLLVMAVLCRTGCDFGGRQGYTLGRLSVSEKTVFLWQAAYNCIALFILWAAQLFIALALCRLYAASVQPESFGPQGFLLAFYRNGFLHSLLPLEETSRYIKNIVMIIALGLCAAAFPLKQRRGGKGWEAVVMTALCLLGFSGKTGSLDGDICMILLSAAMACTAAYMAFRREEEYEA